MRREGGECQRDMRDEQIVPTAALSMSASVTPAAMDTMSFLSVRDADTCVSGWGGLVL